MFKQEEKRKKIIDFISKYTEKTGFTPSIREIGEAVGLSSSSTVHYHLRILEEKGYLNSDKGKKRTIRLTGTHNKKILSVPIMAWNFDTSAFTSSISAKKNLYVPSDKFKKKELFALEIKDESLKNIEIHKGDFIIVEKTKEAASNDIIVININGTPYIRRLEIKASCFCLCAENDEYLPIEANSLDILGKLVAVQRFYSSKNTSFTP